MQSSSDQSKKPLDGDPPSFADLFRNNEVADEPAGEDLSGGEAAKSPETGGRSDALPAAEDGEQLKLLPECKAELSAMLAVKALGLESVDFLPIIYSEEDAHKFSLYIETHSKELKAFLPGRADGYTHAQADVDQVFAGGREVRRVDVLLRWFRDRTTPADLNPRKLVDPKAEAKGNLLQLLHPLLFNALFFGLSVAVILVTFTWFFREVR